MRLSPVNGDDAPANAKFRLDNKAAIKYLADACMIMKIAVGFPAPLRIGIQPVIVHNLKFSLIPLSKREFLPFCHFIIFYSTLAIFII